MGYRMAARPGSWEPLSGDQLELRDPYSLSLQPSVSTSRSSVSGQTPRELAVMSRLLYLLTLVGLLRVVEASSDSIIMAGVGLSKSEYTALESLYNATNGWNWRWTDLQQGQVPWNFSLPANPCTDDWQGLQCILDATPEYHISVIELPAHNLVGSIPNSIANFPYLQHLNLPANSLNGTIPCALSMLSELVFLGLKTNDLTGPIPECLGSLSELQHLSLDFNRLTGAIPTDMWSAFTNISILLISHNHLTGTIPEVLGTLTTLTELYLSYNKLEGTIPGALAGMVSLLYLDMDANSLTGTVPDLRSLSNLISLGLRQNDLSGTLPAYTYTMHSIAYLFLDSNQFTGTVSRYFGKVEKLKFLQLQNNLLTGTIPQELSELTFLRYLYVNNNLLIGTVPTALAQLRKLESILLHQNALTGSLTGVFNATVQHLLDTIQVSNNQFTGPLPAEVFNLPKLATLIAVSNCFTGLLPENVCAGQALLTLALDGLRSASNCRQLIMPAISSAYALSNDFGGTIPACLFALPVLNTLHLSGNALTGTLPSDVVINNELIDLSLSHNILSGSIPENIQNRVWYDLDLSFNRFKGVMRSDFYEIQRNFSVQLQFQGLQLNYTQPPTTASLKLQNNRLSGNIPGHIKSLQNITILAGNLFACNIPQTNLPQYDNGRRTYECGSNAFDVPYFIWLGGVVLIAAATGAFLVWRDQIDEKLGVSSALAHCRRWLKVLSMDNDLSDELNSKLKNVSYVCTVFDVVTSVCAVCTVFVLFVVMPVLIPVSRYYGTHTRQYAYTVSMIFTSGKVPFALDFLLFAVVVALMVAVFAWHIKSFDHLHERLLQSYVGDRSLFLAARSETEDAADKYQASKLERVAVCMLFFLLSVTVVLGVNIAFVYVALYESTVLFVIAQVLLSFFKVVWNLIVSPFLIQWTSNYLHAKASADRKATRTGFFSLQLFVSLFNNIAIPCLVVSVIDPNCLYNMLVPVEPETSRFLYAECDDYAIVGCVDVVRTVASATYNPPFKYSYQCSASFITYYAPTFVYVCVVTTFISPLIEVAAYYMYRNLRETSYLYGVVSRYMPPLLKPVLQDGADIRRDIFNPLFNPNAILISQLTLLCLLLTFGVLFPPLAVAILFTAYASALFQKLKIGRFISLALEKNSLKYLDIIRVESQGVGSVLKLREALWMIGTFSLLFYTLFLFDTLGDEVGAGAAGWVLVVVPISPLALYIIRSTYTYQQRRKAELAQKHRQRQQDPWADTAVTMEMRPSSIGWLKQASSIAVNDDHKLSDERTAADPAEDTECAAATTFNALQLS